MGTVGIGIVGAGYIGSVHAGVLRRNSRARVAAVYDVDGERAAALAATTGASQAHSVADLIAAVDAVYVTTPNTRHVETVLEALTAGRHVFCEKPMATTVAEAKSIHQAASTSKGVFQVGHNRRFAPVYVELKRRLEENPPHSAHAKMNRGELLTPVWVGDRQTTGGFLYETTIHMFDTMRFLFGEVAAVCARGSTHEYAEMDDFSVVLDFESGLHATLCSSADAGWAFPFERVEVFGHHSTLITREMESLSVSEGLDNHCTIVSMHQLSKEEKWGYEQEDTAFIEAIQSGGKAQVTSLDGLRSVEIVDGVYRAVGGEEIVRLGPVKPKSPEQQA